MEPHYFDPQSSFGKSRNHLPHWFKTGIPTFVTFRLADALPAGLLRSYETERASWLRNHPTPWSLTVEREYHQRFSVKLDHWLDDSHGECLLRDSSAAQLVEQTLLHFDDTRHHQLAWIIMPNHVHCVFVPSPGWALDAIVSTWKSYSARRINALRNRSGAVWQKDYFDRLIRDGEHLYNVVRYIRRNPIKAKLSPGEYRHWESEEIREWAQLA